MPTAYYHISSGTVKLEGWTQYGYYVFGSGRLIISSGGTAPEVWVGENDGTSAYGGYVEVLSRGSISSGSVENGGSLVVSEGGNLWNFSFRKGYGTLKMGAYCDCGTVYSGGELAAFGANVYNIKVESGGSFFLYTESSGSVISSGSATNMHVLSGGTMYFASRTIAEFVYISAGGFLYLNGLAISNSVSGTFVVSSGGTATGNNFRSGGIMYVYGSASSSYISSGGVMRVSSGGKATINHVSEGATMYVHGAASSSYISSGGVMKVFNGGTATTNHVSAGGSMEIASSGTVSATTVSSGGSMDVLYGGTASATTVSSGGNMTIASGGKATGIKMSSGSMWIMSGGTASGTVMSGGSIRIDGDSYKGVYNGGTVIINNGGHSENEVFSAGKLYIYGSGSASGNVYNGTIGSGVTMNISGGRFGGTTVSNAIINVTTGTADMKRASLLIAAYFRNHP